VGERTVGGLQPDSKTPAEFNITPLVRDGTTACLWRSTAIAWQLLESQDMWRLAGIERDVRLVAVPKVHIRDSS